MSASPENGAPDRTAPASDVPPAPSPEAVPPRALRWSCPRGWIDRQVAIPEPAVLWGQDRVVDALDRLALRSTRDTPPAGLDLASPGRGGESRAVAQALRARLPGEVAVWDGTLDALRRSDDDPGLLSSPAVDAVVLDVRDLQSTDGAWPLVRQALVHGRGPGDGSARAQLVVLGPDSARKKLKEADAAWDSAFVERTAFIPDLPRDRDGVAVVSALVRRTADELGAGAVEPGAVRFLVEQLAGRGARRQRVALRMDRIGLVLVEARHVQAGGPLSARSVREAWERLRWRGGAAEEGHRARIALRQLKVRTTGAQRGVVNGLMVYGGTDASYCIPGRISARAGVGRKGVVNIEREAKYSGRSFDKGILHLDAWLRGTFAGTSHPLGLTASITFEQSYGKIDGDSATVAETLALLSELASLPVRQDIAVTGAMNHRGELMPVGSGSLKVRGWWESCRAHGPLTGSQGVLLPRVSVPDLQLDRDVLADVRAGRFHVWTADRVEEAAELVMGRDAGHRTPTVGRETILWRAARTLRAMSERLHPPRKPATKPPKTSAKPT